jgi:hypothetical protein
MRSGSSVRPGAAVLFFLTLSRSVAGSVVPGVEIVHAIAGVEVPVTEHALQHGVRGPRRRLSLVERVQLRIVP